MGWNKTKPKSRELVAVPEGFTWTDAPITIYKNELGKFETDFDVSDYEITGKTYYVSLNGSDSNNGLTLGTAFATVQKALTMSDVDVVLVAEGLYKKTNAGVPGLGTSTVTIPRPCTIKSMSGKVIFSMHQELVWTLTSGKTNTYQASRSGVGRIFDAKYIDNYGDYQEINKVLSIDEVENNTNSWYTDGTIVYVHTVDNRQPDTLIRPYFSTVDCIKSISGHSVYLEGIEFEGGGSVLAVANTAILSPNIYTKNCKFKYSTANDAVNIEGATNFYAQNCEVAKSYGDGFNYHILNEVISNVIEVNCVGRDNGGANVNIDNGSTMHDGGKVIRVNGAYFRNKGSNIGDINTGTQTWNLGCVNFDSLAQTDDKFKSNFTAHADAEMWNDGCYSYGSLNANTVQDNATMHLRNCRMEGGQTLEGTGQVLTY